MKFVLFYEYFLLLYTLYVCLKSLLVASGWIVFGPVVGLCIGCIVFTVIIIVVIAVTCRCCWIRCKRSQQQGMVLNCYRIHISISEIALHDLYFNVFLSR